MSKRFPDLEIYIKRVEPAAVLTWLETRFNLVKVEKKSLTTNCSLHSNKLNTTDESDMLCVILEKAAKGGYVSIWFKQNGTPWDTDKDCAQAAYSYFSDLTPIDQENKTEIRCSTGGWEGEDEGGWFRLTQDGEQLVNWF